MEVFYSRSFEGGLCTLDPEESGHCVRVLRHRKGEEIFVIDGEGTLYTCVLTDASPKGAVARIVKEEPDWGAHPYFLQMAVCPTKNLDRYEWFAEKATELGLDEIVPVIGEHSERRVFKPERLRRILLSASKQSLKGAIPSVAEPLSVKEFIRASSPDDLRLICCCFEGEVPRLSINDVLPAGSVRSGACIGEQERPLSGNAPLNPSPDPQSPAGPVRIVVLIGPEGDFSREEAAMAIAAGFIPVHLGPSRLRTETAALTAVEAVYLHHI
ncbi:MAG: 16S rRNA (uracil(1498)-N(3))-methyltransferase [Bacteroidales bacterium]|nr:16S rRNA (uracil(1498)-N(3))-methyltransferase [Bacteroidales bacterium]